MNLDYVRGLRFAPTENDYAWYNSLLYALAVGFGRDPLDAGELPYFVEALPGRPPQVVPSVISSLCWNPVAVLTGGTLDTLCADSDTVALVQRMMRCAS